MAYIPNDDDIINEESMKKKVNDKGLDDYWIYALMIMTIFGSSNNFNNERLAKLETKVDMLEKFTDKE